MKVLMVLIFSMIVVEIHGLKHFLVEEYLTEMKTHIIHIIKELKSTRFSWKMKLRVGAAFEYDNDDKRIEGTSLLIVIMKNQLLWCIRLWYHQILCEGI